MNLQIEIVVLTAQPIKTINDYDMIQYYYMCGILL